MFDKQYLDSLYRFSSIGGDFCEYWFGLEAIPEGVKKTILSSDSDNDVCYRYDFLTPMQQSLAGFYRYLSQYQPKVAELVLQGSELFLAARFKPKETDRFYHLSMHQVVNGKLITFDRSYRGGNPTDESYQNEYRYPLYPNLPKAIRLAYYTYGDGFTFSKDRNFIFSTLLRPEGQSEDLDSMLCGDNGDLDPQLARQAVQFYQERIPAVIDKHGEACLCCFLSTDRKDFDRENIFQLFVKTHIADGIVYCVKGRDFKNTRVISDPAKAIDDYCYYILSNDEAYTRENPFDFMPYTEDVGDRWGELAADFYQNNKDHVDPNAPEDKKAIYEAEKVFKNKLGLVRNVLTFKPETHAEKEIQTKFGGQPDWVQEAKWPLSRALNKPMRFVGQVILKDTLQMANKSGKLSYLGKIVYIFLADNDGAMVDKSYEHNSGENAVIIQDFETDTAIISSPRGPSVSDFEAIDLEKGEEPIYWQVDLDDSLEPKFISQVKRAKLSTEQDVAYEVLAKVNKLGGAPYFVQGDEFPTKSAAQWNLVLQLQADDCPFHLSLGDSGILYVFVNNKGDKGSLCWQCA